MSLKFVKRITAIASCLALFNICNYNNYIFAQENNINNIDLVSLDKESREFSEEYKKFLDNSKTEREVINYALEKAKTLGFTEFDYSKKYNPGDKVYLLNNDKNIILCVFGKNNLSTGIKLAVAHADSPRLDLKLNMFNDQNDLLFLKTHYYGGIQKQQWLNIPLALHGTVITKNQEKINIIIGENTDEPCFCIADLLAHLSYPDRKITGEGLVVLAGCKDLTNTQENTLTEQVLKILEEKYKITQDDLDSSELCFVPAGKSRDLGFDKNMIGGYGHDDRSGVYCALESIFNLQDNIPAQTSIVLLTDKEETGSNGKTGAQSKFFKNFISDIANQQNIKSRHVLSKSKCLSVDTTAAYDPNFADRFDYNNSVFMGKGVCISKYNGYGGKYETSDASPEFMREIINTLDNKDIFWQSGIMGTVDNGSGGTIADYYATQNMEVIDIGVPVLSMHAPLEIISKIDLYMTYKSIYSFFES